jgi:hypothetical protein
MRVRTALLAALRACTSAILNASYDTYTTCEHLFPLRPLILLLLTTATANTATVAIESSCLKA